MLQYISTRGASSPATFSEAVIKGIAADGGLYIPMVWPQLGEEILAELRGKSFQQIACVILSLFCPDVRENIISAIVQDVFSSPQFSHRGIAPLKQLKNNLWLLELFYGPTFSSKDFSLGLTAALLEHVLPSTQTPHTVLMAAQGDTGAAAVEAFRGKKNIELFVLYPVGDVPDRQKRAITSVTEKNIHAIAIDGMFDQCQELVKALLNDEGLTRIFHLGTANSFNIARVIATIIPVIYAALNLGSPERTLTFCVPTGNFTSAFACYAAYRMGIPIGRIVYATNANNALRRFYDDGIMKVHPLQRTVAPDLDVTAAANFERLLFELCDRKAGEIVRLLASYRASGSYDITPGNLRKFRTLFFASSATDSQIVETMVQAYRDYEVVIDPQTAVALHAVNDSKLDEMFPAVVLAPCHPVKFSETVLRAIAVRPSMANRHLPMSSANEKTLILPADFRVVSDYIRMHARRAL